MSKDLHDLIRDTAESYPKADPREIARHVAKLTDERQVYRFLEESLVPVVRSVLISQRTSVMGKALQPGSNFKLEQRRSWWRQMLASRVHVGSSVWKTLGECSAEDLRFCIAERREDVARIEAQVGLFEQLIARMAEFGVGVVAELPEQNP